MSAADALKAALAASIEIEVDGEDLAWEAPVQPPDAILDLLSRHKAEIVALLQGQAGFADEDWQAFYEERAGIFEFDGGLPRPAAQAQAFEACVIEWLNRNPAPSSAGSCGWCGGRATDSAAVVPFGTEPGTHTWLHSECWRPWSDARRAEAVKALSRIGIVLGQIQGVRP